MKIKILSALSFVTLLSIIIYSCKKKESTPAPVASTSADYVGTWNTTSHCTTSMTYVTTISANGASAVVLTNFHAGNQTNGYKLNATISDNTITIASQTTPNAQGGNPLTFSGSGTLTPPSSLSITYTAKDPSSSATLSCTASCSK